MSKNKTRTHILHGLITAFLLTLFFTINVTAEIPPLIESENAFLPSQPIEEINSDHNKQKGHYYLPSKKIGLKFFDQPNDSEDLDPDEYENQLIEEDKELVYASSYSISAENIDQVIYLINHFEGLNPHIKITVLIEDRGIQASSTQRYAVYLNYLSTDEKANISGSFLITDKAYEFIYVKKFTRGNYEIKVAEHDSNGNLLHIIYDIDAIKIFIQEEFLRSQCEFDFCTEKMRGPIRIKKNTFDPYKN